MITFNKYGRGFSTQTGKQEIIDYIKQNISKDAKILDAGFGCGIYARLLRKEGYNFIDGVDIYEHGIKELKLDKYYDNIFITDILEFDFTYYDLIILGDVLEHLSPEDSKQLLENWICDSKMGRLIISIPYQLKQSGTHQNPHEEHLQSQVTAEYMKVNYPYLNLLYSGEMVDVPGKIIAVYTWQK